MIEIDRSKCKKMLVWDRHESDALEREVICRLPNNKYLTSCMNTYKYAKPLPESKPMTALDAMWWAGTRKVIKEVDDESFWCISTLSSTDSINVEDYGTQQWNELIRENGETKLKYEEWKPFTFDECDMGEG